MSGLREELAAALCVIYGDVIDEALHEADALLPLIERYAAARAAEELRAAADDLAVGRSSCSEYAEPGTNDRAERESLAQELGVTFQPHWPEEYAGFCDGCAAAQSADHVLEDSLSTLRTRAAALDALDPS